MKQNILVIGAGQLGSRHLQALANLNCDFSIYVVEKDAKAIELAKDRYDQVSILSSPKVTYVHSLAALETNSFFVCIVATSSANRLGVIKQLANVVTIEHMILEKVLFQSLTEYSEASEILDTENITAWVNCPRRLFEAYQEIASKFSESKSVNLRVTGKNWGLACNAVHFIDLWQYLAKFSSYEIEFSSDTRPIDSSRYGYQELIGSLHAKSKDGLHNLTLECGQDESKISKHELFIEIDDNVKIEISEISGVVKLISPNKDVKLDAKLKLIPQSQLTDKLILSLNGVGHCDLTPFDISASLHVEFIRKAIGIFSKQSDKILNIAPIT